MSPANKSFLSCRDYQLLVVYCVLVCGFVFWYDRTLTAHETVGCINIREMMRDGDWIIPHYGGRPWLERPPLPFWLTMPVVALLGDVPASYRLPPLFVAIGCVGLVSWMASVWFGRGIGILSGLILITAREFTHYATAPESDMFLCGVVVIAMSLFVYLEYRVPRTEEEQRFLTGRRPWALLAFFAALGAANLTKGLFFGDLFILVPTLAFLLGGTERWARLRRYIWLPGWALFLAIASVWAIAVYLRCPDVVALWKSDILARYNQGYLREPFWYYLGQLPLVLFPWSLVALVGLLSTASKALSGDRTPERFLWCWALLPVLLLSLPQGKHHHYLLPVLAPWAILAALGLVHLWQWLPRQSWMQSPWPMLVLVLIPGEVALLVWGHLLGDLKVAAVVAWPMLVLLMWWILTRPDVRLGAAALLVLLLPLHWVGHALTTLVDDRYAKDRIFVERVLEVVPEELRLLVLDDYGALDPSWMLFYLGERGQLLHNASFLLCEEGESALVLTRRRALSSLEQYGKTELLFESERSRDDGKGTHLRYGLYRIWLDPQLPRYLKPVYISPMQATNREIGPVLNAERAVVVGQGTR